MYVLKLLNVGRIVYAELLLSDVSTDLCTYYSGKAVLRRNEANPFIRLSGKVVKREIVAKVDSLLLIILLYEADDDRLLLTSYY